MQRIFISSVQKEFAAERTALADYLRTDPLLRRFFEPFLFEELGMGTGDMIERCITHGLPEPTFGLTDGFVTTIWRKPGLALAHVGGDINQVTEQVTEQVSQLINAVVGEMSRADLMTAVGLKSRVNFSKNYIEPALAAGLIERTLPDSPHSPTQKYRLTAKGQGQAQTTSAQ